MTPNCPPFPLSGYPLTYSALVFLADPPENITVSKPVLSVVESRVPEMVLCSARGYPEASYEWRAENSTDETSVVKRNKLVLNKPMHRKDSGNWTCTAINRHGSISTTIRIDVQCKGLEQTSCYSSNVLGCSLFYQFSMVTQMVT